MTNVFISWSGQTSKQIAEELRKWIPATLQFAKPYFTPDDIEKGSKWGSEISKQLAATNVGIICLTPENHTKPWILFEAGALSKDLDHSKVCSVLFGMDNTDITGPLTTFQTTVFDKADFRKLMSAINDAGGERKLDNETFSSVFDMWWPKLHGKIEGILNDANGNQEAEIRSDRELLEEILSLSRTTARGFPESHSLDLPNALLDHFMETISDLLDSHDKTSFTPLYNIVREQLDISGYLLQRSSKANEAHFSRHAELKERFDNIIPF